LFGHKGKGPKDKPSVAKPGEDQPIAGCNATIRKRKRSTSIQELNQGITKGFGSPSMTSTPERIF